MKPTMNAENIIKRCLIMLLILMGLILGLPSGKALAAVPNYISFQGRLNYEGKPPEKMVSVRFVMDKWMEDWQLYPDSPQAQEIIAKYENAAIMNKDGVFNLLLGSVTPLFSEMFINNPNVEVIILVNGVKLGAQPFLSVPYTFRALSADTAVALANPLLPPTGSQVIQADVNVDNLIVTGTWGKKGGIDDGVRIPPGYGPLITRGYHAFSAGKYKGIGSWGLFIDENKLHLNAGIPGGSFHVAKYSDDGTWSRLLTILHEDKGVILPALGSGSAPLIARGDDPFKSGIFNDQGLVGRWGLFKEPQGLIVGIPAIDGKSFRVAKEEVGAEAVDFMKVEARGFGRFGYGSGALLRSTATAYGNKKSTHINLGDQCVTGRSGSNLIGATVGGGYQNKAVSSYSTIAGGWNNMVRQWSEYATDPTGKYGVIAGGKDNWVQYDYGVIAGGEGNLNNGHHNVAMGWYSEVGGGVYAMGAGCRPKVTGDGSFAWADDFYKGWVDIDGEWVQRDDGNKFNCLEHNTFNVRADRGVFLATSQGKKMYVGPAHYDVSEMMAVLKSEGVDQGEIVSAKSKLKLGRSSGRYDENLVGIVSGDETTTLHLGNTESYFEDCQNMPIALNGKVFVKVNAENGAIEPGDYITSSSQPGVGMKATEPGKVVGIALESFDASRQSGKILCFVSLGNRNAKAAVTELEQIADLAEAESAELDLKVSQLKEELGELADYMHGSRAGLDPK